MNWIIQHLVLATTVIIIVAVGSVLLIAWVLSRMYSHEATRPQVASGLASVVITVLFSIILSHIYAVKRDRDNRLRALRDQHFAQLKPVLRAESARFLELANIVKRRGHFEAVTRFEGESPKLSVFLAPDALSYDLAKHFPEYHKLKTSLLSESDDQDKEFRVALTEATNQIDPHVGVKRAWEENAAMSIVEKCMDRGPGVTLTKTKNGFDFESFGQSAPNMPEPITEQINALNAFRAFAPSASFRSHCQELSQRAEVLITEAEELSRRAQLQSETTILKGNCEFLKSSDLTD
jgi:hypothetical protein